jgi:hypothetical protein
MELLSVINPKIAENYKSIEELRAAISKIP